MFFETENPNAVFDGGVDGEMRKLPRLLMAAAAIFIINLIVLSIISFSPHLLTSHVTRTAIVDDADKMSPFTEVASTAAAPKVRGAMKMRPVLVETEPPPEPVTATIPADNLH